MPRYQGHCHCEGVAYRLTTPEIETAMMCNCSICRRKNLVLSEPWFTPAELSFSEGFDSLSIYRWQDCDVNHLFCPTCGVHIGVSSIDSPTTVRLNLGCIDALDLTKLSIRHFNGRELL